MATTNTLGKVVVTPKGNYDATITYEPLDIVNNNGATYICLESCTGVTPGSNAAKWMLLANSETYSLSLTGNVLSLNGSNGTTTSVTFATADDRVW